MKTQAGQVLSKRGRKALATLDLALDQLIDLAAACLTLDPGLCPRLGAPTKTIREATEHVRVVVQIIKQTEALRDADEGRL